MRPMDREEMLSHLFVMGIAAFMIVASVFLVQPAGAMWVVIGIGAVIALTDAVVAAGLRRPPDR